MQSHVSQAHGSLDEGQVKWVETCFCPTPLEEERPYWEAYFDLVKVQDAHDRKRCRDLTGEAGRQGSKCIMRRPVQDQDLPAGRLPGLLAPLPIE